MSNQFGNLLTQDIKLHRQYFKEMCKLLGIQVIYRSPKPNKSYTTYAEIDANYDSPILVGCIFENHPSQKTMKMLGWLSELQTDTALIHIPYDTPNVQRGSLFIIPSGIDNTQGRVFRLTEMAVDVIYPSAITCTLVPEYENTYNVGDDNYTNTDFNILSVDLSEDHL